MTTVNAPAAVPAMTDERLGQIREFVDTLALTADLPPDSWIAWYRDLLREVDRLRARDAELARVREALTVIATQSGYEWSETREQLHRIIDAAVECARTALTPQPAPAEGGKG
jgi:hypothetical protein